MTVTELSHRESRRKPIVYGAAVLAATFGLAAAGTSPGMVGALVILWAVSATIAAAIDMRTGRLLNVIILPAIVLVLGLSVRAERLDDALLGTVLLGLPMLVTHLFRPDGLGFGDVKFGILLGAGIGVVAVPLVVPAYLLAAVAHFGVCIVKRAHDRLVPFGPALAGASILTVVAELLRRL
jgi:leader peptidase (prepilin peptidase)/N-methyltransferase